MADDIGTLDEVKSMIRDKDNDYLAGLVRELCKLPRETEWVEFKHNNENPHEIGEYISALANAAALNGKAFAYLIWGVEDETHEIIGTEFSPFSIKKGNEPLETWLLRLLSPKIHFLFYEVSIESNQVIVLEIARATRHPVMFSGTEYIRIGEVKKPLKEAPDRERNLWRIFDHTPFEDLIAVERVENEDVLRLLDYPAYFDLIEQPLPENRIAILNALSEDNLIRKCEAGGWTITNLGAILFAKNLRDFPQIKRKAMRVIQYRGVDRTDPLKEQEDTKGYASGFAGLIDYLGNLLPSNEVIEQQGRIWSGF